MTRPYFMLVTREVIDGLWHPQFGDHDRDCVKQERTDTYPYLSSKAWKIVRCKSARRSDCEAAINKLNEQIETAQ